MTPMTEEEITEAIKEHATYPMEFFFVHTPSETGFSGLWGLSFSGSLGDTTLPSIQVKTSLYAVSAVTMQRVFAKARLVGPLIDRLLAADAECEHLKEALVTANNKIENLMLG